MVESSVSATTIKSDSPIQPIFTRTLKIFPTFERTIKSYFPSAVKNLKSTPMKVTEKRRLTRNSIKRRLPFAANDDCYFADQNHLGCRCRSCNMIYPRVCQNDNQLNNGPSKRQKAVNFKGWKNQHLVKYYSDGSKIIAIRANDPKYMLKRLDQLFTLADAELSINISLFDCIQPNHHCLVYITCDQKIAGFVVGYPIKRAYKLLDNEQPSSSTFILGSLTPAQIAISRIWVHSNYRRQGIATRLVDTLRADFNPCQVVDKNLIAFENPTKQCKDFAEQYSGQGNVLIV